MAGLCSTSQGSARMCVWASFCTQEIDSRPPATITGTRSTITRCAAMAMACSPEEQNRLTVVPAVVTGSPARSAICLATFPPVVPSESAAHDHVLDLAGFDSGTLDGGADRVRAHGRA